MRTLATGMLVLALALPLSADTKFLDTFKAPEAINFTFFGQKVAALVVSDDLALRQSAETELATRLSARGMRGVETYRIVPGPETRDPIKARAFLEQSEVQGVVIIRPLRLTSERAPSIPVMWNSPTYGGLWDYWGYGWGAVYEFGPQRRDTVLVTETLVYSLPLNKLMWAAITRTKNPREAQAYVRG
ncbi:MAG: hypothetical protein OEW19_22210, partial [Acidobacteriota bacterium]|nr:hypothetical protein [Acidobacteriota bacterium]